MNGGEEAGDEVTVQILVVAHLVHALSFIPSHLGLMFVPGPSLSKYFYFIPLWSTQDGRFTWTC